MQTVFLERTLGKQTLNALFLIVTRLSGRAGGWKDCAGVAGKCKEEYDRVEAQFWNMRLTGN
jgi:hypothetical protein